MSGYKMYSFGCLAPTLKSQGYPMSDADHEREQCMADGLNMALIQGVLTEKEYDRALDRLWKWSEKRKKVQD